MKLTSRGTSALASPLAAALAGCGGGRSGGGTPDGGQTSNAARSRVRRRRHVHHGAVGRPGQPRPAVVGRARRCSPSPSSPTTRWSASTARPARSSPSWPASGRSTAPPSRSPWTRASPAPTAADFTATTAADNINFVADPKNKSPFLGTFLPVGATAKADDAAGTVTITLAQPAPFVLNGLASLPMVCPSGMSDRGLAEGQDGRHRPLRAHRGRAGRPLHLPDPRRLHLGPERRHHRREGPARHRRDEDRRERDAPPPTCCSPATSTRPRSRARTPSGWTPPTCSAPAPPAMVGEQWYNHDDGRETSDPAVRMALTQALDLDELASVATAGPGRPGHHASPRSSPSPAPATRSPASLPGPSDVDAAKDRARPARTLDLPLLQRRGQPRWPPPRSSPCSSGRPQGPT